MNENTFAVGTVSVGDDGDILTFSEPVALPANMKSGDRIEIEGLPVNAIAELVAPDQARLVRAHAGVGFVGRRYIAFNMPSGWATNYGLQSQTAENIRRLNSGVVVRVGYKTRAELFADLTPADAEYGKVWNDDTYAFNGVYKKIGPSGGGSWVWYAPLWETEVAKTEADRATSERQAAQSARTGAETALATVNALADVLSSAASVTAPADYPTRDAAAVVIVPAPQLMVRTGGRFQVDDAGGALYKRDGGVLQPGGFTDAGGAVWNLVGGEVSVESCGADADYATALGAAIDRAGQINGSVVHRRRRVYTATSSTTRTDLSVTIYWNGCLILRGIAHPNEPVLKLSYSFATPVQIAAQASVKIWAGYPVKEVKLPANPADGDTLSLVQKNYVFKTVPTGANDVLIGATPSDTLDNLVAAFNGAAGIGVKYGAGTVASTRATAKRMTDDAGVKRLCIISKVRCVTPSKWNNAGTAAVTVTEAHSQTDVWRADLGADATGLGFAADDVVKAFSWDPIAHSRTADNERMGEIFQVGLVDGNFVYSLRPLRIAMGSDPVTSNPRLSRMTKRVVRWDRPWIEDEPGSPETRNTPLLHVIGATKFEMAGARCSYGLSSFVRLESCWKAFTDDTSIENLRTNIEGYYGTYGYGLEEYGSTDPYHRAMRGSRLRHPRTGGARTCVSTETDPNLFGGIVGGTIDGLYANECENSGIDGHPPELGVVYNNPVVVMNHQGAEAGVWAAQLRGDHNVINDAVIIGAGAVRIKTYGTGTGNVVSIKSFIRPTGYTVVSPIVMVDGTEATPGFQSRATISGALQIDNYGNSAISFDHADIDATGLSVDYQNSVAASGAVFFGKSGQLTIDGLAVDFRRSTAIQPRVFKAGDAAMVVKQMGPMRVQSTEATVGGSPIRWVVGDLDGFNATIVCPAIKANVPPSSLALGGFTNVGAAAVAWAGITIDNGLTVGPRVLAFAHASSSAKTLSFPGRGDAELLADITSTSAVAPPITLISAPAYDGQKLVLYGNPASTGSSRVPTSCTNVVTAVDLYLLPGRTLRFFAKGGAWVAERTFARLDGALFWGDVGVNLSAVDAGAFAHHIWNTPLTAGRAISAPTLDLGPIYLERGLACTGDFVLSVSPSLGSLRLPGDRMTIAWDPTAAAYVQVNYGSLGGARVRGNTNTVDTATDLATAIYNSNLSVPRTHTLPSSGPGRRRITRTAAATGNTLSVYQPDGVTVIATIAAGNWMDFDREATGGWWITAQGAL